MTNNKKTPAIRFKGFNDDWEQRKLSLLAERFDNLRIPVTASNRIPGNTPYYGANGILDYVDGFTHDGEFILIAEDGANDLNDYPVHYVNGKVWVNNHAHVIQAKEDIADNKFLKYSFKILDIAPYLVGGSRAKLNVDIMMDLIIDTPKLDEQIKLGKFFSSLDNLITLHQRKCDKLIIFKKAMLEKMFPKNGENLPEVRFEGFNDDWEQRKLGEITNSIDTGRSKFVSNSNGEYEILGSTSVIGYDDNYDYEGDFLLTARVGANAGELYRHSGRVKISDNTVFIQGKNLNFIFYMLMNFDIKKLSFGTGQPLIKASELRELELMLPKSSEEQQKIGTFFNSLDNLITLHQRKPIFRLGG